MIECKILNRSFETKSELFHALKGSKEEIISLKRATIKNSDGVGFDSNLIEKLLNNEETKGFSRKSGYFYPIINSTNIMDSHKDVHFNGIWNKSVVDQKGKIYYIVNHKFEVGSVIAYPKDISIMTARFKFSDLGYDSDIETEALIYEINEKCLEYANKDAAYIVQNKLPIQNSVKMQYVKIHMGLDSDDPSFKEEKMYYDKHIDSIANKADVEKEGYFFGVHEAKIIQEGSLVLNGSNSVTPILYASEPAKSTHEPETQKEEEAEESLSLEYEFLKNVKL